MTLRILFKYGWLLLVTTATCVSGVGETKANSSANRHEREDIAQAEKAVLSSLAVAVSPRGQSLCIETPIACLGPDRLELAMSLLSARNSPDSLQALAGLVRFGLDGGFSEDYHDLVIGKGHAIEPFLIALSPQHLHERCEKEFTELIQTNGPELGHIREPDVCRSETEIKTDIGSTLDAIRRHRRPE